MSKCPINRLSDECQPLALAGNEVMGRMTKVSDGFGQRK
jgi:hypothetical protein